MKTYNATYKFVKNEIHYESKITGQILEPENDEIDLNHVSNLSKGISSVIINAVIWAISDEQNGMFIDGKSVFLMDTKLMQDNANDSYSVFIDGNLYPISIRINTKVTSSTFELLKKQS